jgi:replicative DNA helicase
VQDFGERILLAKREQETLRKAIETHSVMKQVECIEEIIDMLDKIVPTAANLAYYAKIVRDKATARSLIEVSTSIAQLGYESHGDVEKLRRARAVLHHRRRDRARPRTTASLRRAHERFTVDELRPTRRRSSSSCGPTSRPRRSPSSPGPAARTRRR